MGGASTNYFSQPPYLTSTPSPQIAVGPDDILTIVNRTIARYPNPNASGNRGAANPYNYPPTDFVPLDVWMGISVLGPQAGAGALCPSGTGSNATCVIDNASIRYDQLQGRFVVLFTVTDMPAHRANWVLVVSTSSQFQKSMFTPPVIAPIVGGTQTGGVNPANWVLYKIPINLQYLPNLQPNALGLARVGALANSAVGTPNTVFTGGSSTSFLTTPFCANGGPLLPLTYGNGASNGTAGGTGRTCTNYFPTGARFGLDNDNIILTAPVLDQAYSQNEGSFPSANTPNQGPYAGTRVTSIAKIAVYNGTALNFSQPGPGGCTADAPIDCQAVNLSDNVATGTLTEITTQVAFGQGGFVAPAPDLQYGVGAIPNSCFPTPGSPVAPSAVLKVVAAESISTPVLSCAPLASLPTAIPPIFWEPDNLRGRALASFNAQVAPLANSPVAGVVTPVDYLVGTAITDTYGTHPFGLGIVPQGVPGVTGQPQAIPPGLLPGSPGIATTIYVQPIAFSCPGSAIYSGPSSVAFCGSSAAGGNSQIAELPVLGPLRRNVSTLAEVGDPAPVGQGFSASQMTTSPANTPVSSTSFKKLFVGDSRPEQVMFREGLLYVARTVRLADQGLSWLSTSTVLYDVLKSCAAGPVVPTCGAYSITGAGLSAPALTLETEWFNGQNVPDPKGNIPGFGFYQPMFESPADVVSSLPTSPVNLLPWFDKLFVGMTTGGTGNTDTTFTRNFASLWDFRPGDDAFDTAQPYLDPYTGSVVTTTDCGTSLQVNVLGANANAITVADPAGLVAGMILQGTQIAIASVSGNTVTLSAPYPGASFPVNVVFVKTAPVVSVTATQITTGSRDITVASADGLAVGQVLASGSPSSTSPTDPPVGNFANTAYTCIALPCSSFNPNNITFAVSSLVNTIPGLGIVGGKSAPVPTTVTAGSAIINVPLTSQVATNMIVTGAGIPAGTTVLSINPKINADTTIQITLSAAAAGNGSSVTFDAANCFTGSILAVTDSSNFFVNNNQLPLVATTGTVTCNMFYGDPFAQNNFQVIGFTAINNGIPVNFTSAKFFPPGTTITAIDRVFVTLSNPAANPLAGGATGVTFSNIPLNFVLTSCPMIPFSTRGGASTDPNDGSIWLFGSFAKNRLSTIPGPGQWGTAVANYPLSLPAVDPYNNDNSYFQDVQPAGSANSAFFTWIQLAKNLGIAVPSATGPCVVNNGGTPVQQPPTAGTQPVPGTSQLVCPYFKPDAIVSRAEMAYWVVKAQMDEAQVTNYLCATGGDPTGSSGVCSGGVGSNTFSDLGAIVNPFVGVSNAQLIRYIEVMARRGYTKGCGSTNDPLARYCPNDPVTRAQMSVFLVRAKMNNVFPTTLSGTPVAGPYGDNFGILLPPTPYFTDVTANDAAYGPYYLYIQKMRELRITNGTSGSTFSPGANLTRKEIATFIVRAFFL